MRKWWNRFMKRPEGPLLFDRKALVTMIIPLMAEQLLSVTVGIADTMMVSVAGETAISGISLVNQIAVLMIVIFSSMASGGTVVAAQYLGKRDYDNARSAARHLIHLCVGVSIAVSAFSLLTNRWLLGVVFGSVESGVMEAAVLYFAITAFSFPFLGLYNACSSLFRAMGNTRIALTVSVIMNVVNIGGNAVLIYGFGMGVAGAAIATLASRIIAALVVFVLLLQERWPANARGLFRYPISRFMVGQVLKIGVPQALENGMFHVGKLLTTSLISSFGTASIAAYACASNVEQMCYIPAYAMGIALVTVVGQCVGANDYAQAKYYSKKVILYTYLFLWVVNSGIFLLAHPIVGMYHLSEEGAWKSVLMIRHYNLCCMAIYPFAFTAPNILRAAGDARYTLITSSVAMWVCRVVMAYVLGLSMEARYGLGVYGVWISMTLDWAVRAFFNIIRLAGNKWTTKSLVA